MTDPVSERPQDKREGMPCPNCSSHNTGVLRKRFRTRDITIRRRHKCLDCGRKFSTLQQRIEDSNIVAVVK